MGKKYTFFIVITCIYLMSLFVIYYLDPTHDYPNLHIETDLAPGEKFTFSTPENTRTLFGFLSTIYPVGKLLNLKTSNPGFALASLGLELLPDVVYGLDEDAFNKTIINTKNETTHLVLDIIKAIDVESQSKYKNYWYLVASLLNMFITIIFAINNTQYIYVNKNTVNKPSLFDSFILFCCGCCTCCLSKKTKDKSKSQTLTEITPDVENQARVQQAPITVPPRIPKILPQSRRTTITVNH